MVIHKIKKLIILTNQNGTIKRDYYYNFRGAICTVVSFKRIVFQTFNVEFNVELLYFY